MDTQKTIAETVIEDANSATPEELNAAARFFDDLIRGARDAQLDQ